MAAAGGAAIALAAVLLAGGLAGRPAPIRIAAPSRSLAAGGGRAKAGGLTPPVLPAGAREILARYTATVNKADASFSPAVLGAVGGQGSYALIAGYYKQKAAAKAKPPAAYRPRPARFYIPLEPAAYPHWFAVRVDNVTTGGTPVALGTQYLVFAQQAAGAAWKDVDQPYALGTPPAITVSAAGYATAVAAAAPGLAVAPRQIAGVTAGSLDGHGAVPDPGNLADVHEAAGWRHVLAKAATVSLAHAAASYPVFGLRTATLMYLDQFAAYDPPATIPGLSIVAGYSGIIS